MSASVAARRDLLSPPLWGRGGEGGVTSVDADGIPPSLTLPHRGGGNAPERNLIKTVTTSAHVRDADGLVRERFAAILRHMIAVHCDNAGKADDGPAQFVAVAAIDRVGIHALDDGLVERGPEHPRRQAVVEGNLAGRESNQNFLALGVGDPVECSAVSLVAMSVGGGDAGAIKLCRRQRQLIALAWSAEFPRPLHIKT